MKIALIGGHLSPALAVIDALPKDVETIFIGRNYTLEGDAAVSLEYAVVQEKGIPFVPINAGRLPRVFRPRSVISIAKIPGGLVQALAILRKHKPDVVLGFGGYVSMPVCVAAYMLKIPIVIHEQTLGVGMANKYIARFATKVCVSWVQSEKYFPKDKVVLTGNPVRKFPISPSTSSVLRNFQFQISKENKPLLYITGGSTGAHAINVLIEGCLKELLENFRIIHQTGDAKEYGDYPRLQEARSKLPKKLQERYSLTKFINPEDVGAIMKEADLVISRSGMNTVTELLAFGKPCLLIPLPYGQKNEQLVNASFVKKVGIGDYVLQENVTSADLFRKIETMVEHISPYQVHASQAKKLVHSDAAERIIDIVYEVFEKTQAAKG